MKQINNEKAKDKNNVTIHFSIKTQLILLAQQQKQSKILLQLSLFPLKSLQQALDLDENNFISNLNEVQKKILSKAQRNLKYQTLALISEEELIKIIQKDCKSSFQSWKCAQLVAYFNLFASRNQHLNAEQQLDRIQEAESIISSSNVSEDFLKEDNFKIIKLMFILEKIRIWIQMGDFIKSTKTFLLNEEYLKTINDFDVFIKNDQDKRRQEWIMLIKSQIYVIYAFTMQKVKEFKMCIGAYETYLKLKENIIDIQFVQDLHKYQEQKNSYYALYIYFYYKYCKALIKDVQDEKALQSVYKIEFILNKFQQQSLLKQNDIQIFQKKLKLLIQNIEGLLKNKVVNKIQKQNDSLFTQPLKFKDEQLKQIKLFFKMTKQSEQEKKQKEREEKKNLLNRSRSDGDLAIQRLSINNTDTSKNKIPIHQIENSEYEASGQASPIIKDEDYEEKSSFLGSQLKILDSFLDDEDADKKYQVNQELERFQTEESDNLSEKYHALIDKKIVEIEGLTNDNNIKQDKKMTPLNILLAQSEIVMNNFFSVKKFNQQFKTNSTKCSFEQQIEQRHDKTQLTPRVVTFHDQNTSRLHTQPDSRRMSYMNSDIQRYKNNSLFSQNSQLLTSNYSNEIQRYGSNFNRRSLLANSSSKDQSRFQKYQNLQKIERSQTLNTPFKDVKNHKDKYIQRDGSQTCRVRIRNSSPSLQGISQSTKNATSDKKDKVLFNNIYKNQHVRVYSGGEKCYTEQLGSLTDRQILKSKDNNYCSNQQDKQPFNKLFSQTRSKTPNKQQVQGADKNDKQNGKDKTYNLRQKNNYELIKDLDIEFELQFLLGKKNFTQGKSSLLSQNAGAELTRRPATEQNEFEYQQRQDFQFKEDDSQDSNITNYKAVNKNIPNIVNLISENKNNQKVENLTSKYFNLAKTDVLMKKKLNQMTLENLFSSWEKTKPTAQNDGMMPANQKNNFITDDKLTKYLQFKRLNDEQRLYIKRNGGVVYNETKDDYEYMNTDKYGVGYMNQDLEEKMKSVKEELKKIQIIPPQPPTKIEISQESESESINMSNIDVNQQSGVVSRFKQNLKLEMESIHETNLFVNNEINRSLLNRSQQTYKSQYKSSFQRYANKDFFVNSIAQHNITIHKGDEEEQNNSGQVKQDDDSDIKSQDQSIENINKSIYEDNDKKDSEYDYSLLDNLSDLNQSLVAYSQSPQLAQVQQERSRRGSIFRIQNQNQQQRKASYFQQNIFQNKPSLSKQYIPILQGISPNNQNNQDNKVLGSFSDKVDGSNKEIENQHILQSKQMNRFKQYTREKKLSLQISNSIPDSEMGSRNFIENIESETSLKQKQFNSPSLFSSTPSDNLIRAYDNLNSDFLKEDVFKSQVIENEQKRLSMQTIDFNTSVQKRRQLYQKQKHNTEYFNNSPTNQNKQTNNSPGIQFSTRFILNNKMEESGSPTASPTASPFTLQKVFSRFKHEKEQNQEPQITESPTKHHDRLNIEIIQEDILKLQQKEVDLEKSGLVATSTSVLYQKRQPTSTNLIKIKLQSTQAVDKHLQQPQSQVTDSPVKVNSILKIQKFYRKYTTQSKLMKGKLSSNKISLRGPKDGSSNSSQFDKMDSSQAKKSDNKQQKPNTVSKFAFLKNEALDESSLSTDFGLRKLIAARVFQQKIRESQSGAINNQSGPFNKFYPPFKFTRLIQGVPVLWKVKHSIQKEIFNNIEIYNYFLTIVYGNTRFSIKVDLDFAGIQLRGMQYETLWPLYLVAFEKFLRDQNIKINVTKPQNDLKNLPYAFSFFEGLTPKIKLKITDFDLNCVGNLKDLLDLFLRHFFEFQQKVNGFVLEYNKNQIFPQWKLVTVKKAQKKLDRFVSMAIEGKKCHKQDYRNHKKEYELSLQQNERVLQNNLVRFMKENHLLGVFIKRSTGGYYYLLIVKVNFRQSNDISTQIVNGQLMLSDFSFYITGRNLGTYQTILPLEVHATQVMKYFKTNTLIREINKFFLRKRLSNRWITILVNFFSQHLCLTLPKIDVSQLVQLNSYMNYIKKYLKRQGIQNQKSNKVQKLIFRDIMEIKRRIQNESQKQVLLQNPFNDFFLLEQVNNGKQQTAKDDKPQQQKTIGYENLVLDNFNTIYKTFYKSQRDEMIEKNDYSLFQEDDELDKRYEEGYYSVPEEILQQPPQEEIIPDVQQENKNSNNTNNNGNNETKKQVKQGNQLRRKNNIYVVNNQLDLQSQLEGFWRLSNLFGNGRCLRQKVYFCSLGTFLWIRIKMDIIKGIMVATITDYIRGETFKQILKNQKVKQLLINMTTLVPESQSDMGLKQTENLKQIAFQGILEKEKTLLGQKIKIRVQRDEDTLKNPVILNNKDSIKNHLLIDSIELQKYYDCDEYTSLLTNKTLGKIICSIKTFILNKPSDSSVVNIYLFRLTIQLYNSKHYQFKIILGFDDLYQLDKNLYTNLLKQYNKIYAQKLITLIMNRLQLVPTVQGKVPCFLNFPSQKNGEKDLQEDIGRMNGYRNSELLNIPRTSIFNTQQNDKGHSLLRFKRNRFAKTSHNQQNIQQSKTMLDDYVQQSRVIFSGIKQFQGEYCIVTVSKDIMLRYWVFNIYIPKTCRTLVSYFNNSDMMDCSEEFLSKQMSSKIIYFFENPQMTPFKSYRDFIKRTSLSNTASNKRIKKKSSKSTSKVKSSKEIQINNNQNIDTNLYIDVPKIKERLSNSKKNSTPTQLSPKKISFEKSLPTKKISPTKVTTKKNISPTKSSIQASKNIKSVLDFKFEFSNFAEKFNDLREVFEPGIQKKRSISLDSIPNSQSSLASSALISPIKFSPKISTPPQLSSTNIPKDNIITRKRGQTTTNVFNFNQQKVEQQPYIIQNQPKIKSQVNNNYKKSGTSRLLTEKQIMPAMQRQKFMMKLKSQEFQLGQDQNEQIQQPKFSGFDSSTSSYTSTSKIQFYQKQDNINYPSLVNTNYPQLVSSKKYGRRLSTTNVNHDYERKSMNQIKPQYQNQEYFQKQTSISKYTQDNIENNLSNQSENRSQKQLGSSQNIGENTGNDEYIYKIAEFNGIDEIDQNIKSEKQINQISMPKINMIEPSKINIMESSKSQENQGFNMFESQKLANTFFSDMNLEKRASIIATSKKNRSDMKSLYMSILKSKGHGVMMNEDESSINNLRSIRGNSRQKTTVRKKTVVGFQQNPSILQENKVKHGMQYYMKKHFIKLLVIIHFTQYISMKRMGGNKLERTQKFFDLTKLLDDAFIQKQYNNRITNLCKFIEMRLWENLISQSRLEADIQSEHMLFCFENSKLPLHELMFHDFMQIDNNTNHEFNTEICINFIDIVSNKGLKQARKRMKNTNKRMKTKKDMMENFYFTPLDWISYPMTTYFNMYIQNFHLEEGFIQTDVINLREILNIYIAEGYYKYQTNYINSKLNYSDIKSLCQFVVHKMKTSNFLNLMKSQISGNNEGFSQKFSIEENIRLKANYMKRMKSQQQEKAQQILTSQQNDKIRIEQDFYNNIKNEQIDQQLQKVVKNTIVLNPYKGLILKSQFIPVLKEFKFVLLKTDNKQNTTRYKSYQFFSQQIQYLDQLFKAQCYEEILKKVVYYFKNQMLLYHNTNQ